MNQKLWYKVYKIHVVLFNGAEKCLEFTITTATVCRTLTISGPGIRWMRLLESESSPFNKRNPLRRLHQWYFQKYFQTSLRGAGVLLMSSILIFILPIPPPVQVWNSKAWKNSAFEWPSSGGLFQTILPMLSSLRNFSQTQQHPKLLLLYWKGKPKQKEKKVLRKN